MPGVLNGPLCLGYGHGKAANPTTKYASRAVLYQSIICQKCVLYHRVNLTFAPT